MEDLKTHEACEGLNKFFERLLEIKKSLKELRDNWDNPPELCAIYEELDEIFKEQVHV